MGGKAGGGGRAESGRAEAAAASPPLPASPGGAPGSAARSAAAGAAAAEPEAGVIHTEAATHEAREREAHDNLVAADKEKKRRLWEEELERELAFQKEQKLLTKAA